MTGELLIWLYHHFHFNFLSWSVNAIVDTKLLKEGSLLMVINGIFTDFSVSCVLSGGCFRRTINQRAN